MNPNDQQFTTYNQSVVIVYSKSMKRINLTVLLLAVTGTLLLQLTHYYFMPITLQPQCISAIATSPQLGQGSIVECIVCHTPESNQKNNQKILGEMAVLIPYNPLSSVNTGLPIDQTHIGINKEFIFSGSVYKQKLCVHNQCSDLFIPEDFTYSQPENKAKLQKSGMKYYSSSFQFDQCPLRKQLYRVIMPQAIYHIAHSGYLFKGATASLMSRFRYSVPFGIDGESEPIVLFHQLSHHIFIRFALVMVFALHIHSLLALLAHYPSIIRLSIVNTIALSFISTEFAVFGSAVALYLLFNRILDSRIQSIINSASFFSIYILIAQGRVSEMYLTITALVFIIYAGYLQAKQKCNISTICLLVFLSVFVLYGWAYDFLFIVAISPVHLLTGLLLLREEQKLIKKAEVYDLIRINDEEQDVLSKIQRQLQKK